MTAFPLWVNAIAALPTGPEAECALHIGDIFACTADERWHSVLLSSYLIDLNWLLETVPDVGRVRDALCILSGQSRSTTQHPGTPRPTKGDSERASVAVNSAEPLRACFEARGFDVAKLAVVEPPLPFAFGTHHAKLALCANERGLRVAVFTANLVRGDWAHKTQGIYVQDFPRWSVSPESQRGRRHTAKGDDFKRQLSAYLRACGLANHKSSPALTHFSPDNWLDAFDFAEAKVWLVTSTPGRRGAADPSDGGGWQRLRQVLSQVPCPSGATRLTWQYSSQGSLNDAFIATLTRAMLVSQPSSDGSVTEQPTNGSVTVQVVYPTQQEVRECLEGWRGGLSLPLRMQNCHPFINERLHRWGASIPESRVASTSNGAGTVGACWPPYHRYALPHLKTYARIDRTTGTVVWMLLTSANLSQAAWGSATGKGNGAAGHQMPKSVVRSYECGVLFDASSVVETTRTGQSQAFTVTPSRSLSMPTRATCPNLIATPVWQRATTSPLSGTHMMLPFDVVSPEPYSSNASVSAINATSGNPPAAARAGLSRRDVPWVLDFPPCGLDVLGHTLDEAMSVAVRCDEASGQPEPLRSFPAARKRGRDPAES